MLDPQVKFVYPLNITYTYCQVNPKIIGIAYLRGDPRQAMPMGHSAVAEAWVRLRGCHRRPGDRRSTPTVQ